MPLVGLSKSDGLSVTSTLDQGVVKLDPDLPPSPPSIDQCGIKQETNLEIDNVMPPLSQEALRLWMQTKLPVIFSAWICGTVMDAYASLVSNGDPSLVKAGCIIFSSLVPDLIRCGKPLNVSGPGNSSLLGSKDTDTGNLVMSGDPKQLGGSTTRVAESAKWLKRLIKLCMDIFDFVLPFAGVYTLDTIIVPALSQFVENVYVYNMKIWDVLEQSFGEDHHALTQSPVMLLFADICIGSNNTQEHVVDTWVLTYLNLRDGRISFQSTGSVGSAGTFGPVLDQPTLMLLASQIDWRSAIQIAIIQILTSVHEGSQMLSHLEEKMKQLLQSSNGLMESGPMSTKESDSAYTTDVAGSFAIRLAIPVNFSVGDIEI
ncbi:hypothetical protein EV702DRAFT_1050665 [Suillus placidus]|uniref:Uncharacterized protein n=1 Tax=Suillus placidus TaxID=48579 RepID=A0A9P6ZHH0_9AGAM|nr:hypothetical protein EV702DRAFT_1050665 [Suillus placidus]